MDIIGCMNETLSKFVHKKGFWYVVPFGIIAFALVGVYYVVAAIYMLFDYIVLDLKTILNSKNEELSNGAQTVRNIYGFFFPSLFNLVKVIYYGSVVATLYLLTIIFMWISSGFRFKSTPFAFHKLVK